MEMNQHTPVFAIAAAADLAEMHPQTLRQYDRLGLVVPQRTSGNTRRYSLNDVAKLRTIAKLSAEGLSLEGIRRVIELESLVDDLRARVRELESALADAMLSKPGGRVFAAGTAGDVQPLRAGKRTRRQTEVVVWRPFG